MATLTITQTFTGSTPSLVVLSTLTNAVTGADVSAACGVSLPTEFSNIGGNVWTVSFADIGLFEYGYTLLVNFAAGPTWITTGVIAGSGNAIVTGNHYSSLSTLQSLVGSNNLNNYAAVNTQGSIPEINTRIEAALTDSDSKLQAAFAVQSQDVPGTNSVYFPRLSIAAGWFAIGYLYEARAEQDENKTTSRAEHWEEFAMKEIDAICWALARDGAANGPNLVYPSQATNRSGLSGCNFGYGGNWGAGW